MYWYSIDLSGWGTPLTFYNGVFVIHFLFFFFNFFVNFVITSFPFWSPRRDKEELGMKQDFFFEAHVFRLVFIWIKHPAVLPTSYIKLPTPQGPLQATELSQLQAGYFRPSISVVYKNILHLWNFFSPKNVKCI